MTPLVSVILPVYNGEPYLDAAITSITQQTYQNLEIIVINDGSTDGSLSVIRKFASRDCRIRVVSRENRGLVKTLNEGLDLARGKYIARMDADDISVDARIERQIAYLEKNPDVTILGVRTFRTSRNMLHIWLDKGVFGKRASTWSLLFWNYLGHPGVCLRRDVVEEHRLRYKEDYLYAEDYKLWCEISEYGLAAMLNESLLLYRRHQKAICEVYSDRGREVGRKVSIEQLKAKLGIDLGDLLEADLPTWLAALPKKIFESQKFAALSAKDKLAVHLAFQEYSSRHASCAFDYIKTVGFKPILASPFMGLRYAYRVIRYRPFKP